MAMGMKAVCSQPGHGAAGGMQSALLGPDNAHCPQNAREMQPAEAVPLHPLSSGAPTINTPKILLPETPVCPADALLRLVKNRVLKTKLRE